MADSTSESGTTMGRLRAGEHGTDPDPAPPTDESPEASAPWACPKF